MPGIDWSKVSDDWKIKMYCLEVAEREILGDPNDPTYKKRLAALSKEDRLVKAKQIRDAHISDPDWVAKAIASFG